MRCLRACLETCDEPPADPCPALCQRRKVRNQGTFWQALCLEQCRAAPRAPDTTCVSRCAPARGVQTVGGLCHASDQTCAYTGVQKHGTRCPAGSSCTGVVQGVGVCTGGGSFAPQHSSD